MHECDNSTAFVFDIIEMVLPSTNPHGTRHILYISDITL